MTIPHTQSTLPFRSKTCSHCREVKPLSEYGKEQTRPGGLAPVCRPCKSQMNRKYRANHQEQIKGYNTQWYAANAERAKKAAARNRAANPERTKATQARAYANKREEAKARHARWVAANYPRIQALNHQHRARKLTAEGSYTAEEWQALKARYNFRCLRCFQAEPQIVLTIDHIVPLSRGGTNYIHNLQPLCQSCNSHKAVRHICYRPDKLLPSPTQAA